MLMFAFRLLFICLSLAACVGGIGSMVRASARHRRTCLATVDALRTQVEFLALTGLDQELPRPVSYTVGVSTTGIAENLTRRDYRRAQIHAVAGLNALAPHRLVDIVDRPAATAPTGA